MRPRALFAATLLATGLGVPTASAAPPALAGTTVVSGSTGAFRVRVPREATISLLPTTDFTQGRDTTFTGAGRLVAAVLVRTPGTDEVWLGSMQVCMTRGCTGPRRFFAYHRRPGRSGTAVRLPKGTYTLYWITDGKPASATLRFHGLSGRTRLRPPAAPTTEWGPAATLDTVDPVTSSGVRSYEGVTEVSLAKRGVALMFEYIVAGDMHTRTSLCLTTGNAGPGVGPVSPCLTHEGNGAGWMTSTRCGCPVAKRENEFGIGSFLPLDAGNHTAQADARYAGTFGRTGLAVVVLSYL